MNLEEMKKVVLFFVGIQECETKEEAFLKGILFALGGEKVRPKVDWNLVRENPEIFVPIEKDIQDMFEKIRAEDLSATVHAIADIYLSKNKAYPDWLKRLAGIHN